MSSVQDVMQSILSCRDKISLGVRWPLSEVIIDTTDKDVLSEHYHRILEGLKNVGEIHDSINNGTSTDNYDIGSYQIL